MEQLDTKRNLCSECCYPYPECPATENDVIFGDGVGNDNICCCEKFKSDTEDIGDKLADCLVL